ncbi:MAG: serine hydrolase domain-containing protein, partial [Gemmataceae bacterium]
IVPIASATTWLTAATLMTLVDDGKLKLDDPLKKHLPQFTGKKGEITLRQLLAHTSGLPSQYAPSEERGITLVEAVDRIAKVDLVADPGREFRYGGVSMQVAGRLAEVVSGKSWRELFEEKIAKPCAMPNTKYGRAGLNPNPQLAGGASSSLHDYRHFLEMLLHDGKYDGKQVLSKESVREMDKDQTRGAPFKMGSIGRRFDNSKYGLGHWLDRQDAEGHGIEVSSPGAFGFRPWIDRDQQLIGVFLVRVEDKKALRTWGGPSEIQKLVGDLVKATK